MSTTVDQRVVEMRFDNQHFERNVSTTLSTLDKLKQSLKLPDASKGLNSLSNAAKNVDMNSLGRGVEDVRMRFSALEVMGVTALANITNSAVNAGKRIVSALTIDPVKTGFQEYETQINAVQTIQANTQSKGTTIDQINDALNELNTYADKTIYNFTEMTRNIGTFTAAGVDLDTSVSAIQGIANLAAVSGSTSQQASTAMYQLSQALATGTVKLQDWNSVVNAGMGGEVFQNALVQTAAVMAGASEDVEAWRKKNIDSYGSFRDSLTQGEWLTTEVLTATLNQFTMAAEEGSKEWEAYKKTLMDTGYTEKQAEAILEMANTATDAATKVKTFTQLWDVLKESAQSGWSQTWKLIIGDFEEAKSLLTPLADFLTGFINKMSDFRNDILESALGRTFNSMGKKISEILAPATKATEAIKGTVDTITDLGEIVDKVILGKFGNGKERFDALSKAGINYYEVQNKVNEKLNNGKRYTQEQIDAQNKLLGTQTKAAETTEKQAETTEKQAEATVALNDEQKKLLKKLGKMSDEQLRAAGYSEKQIKALNELKATAEDLGIPFGEFIDKLDQINGRWLLMDSFKNIGQGIVDVGKAIGQAWKDVFPEHNVENFANKLFNLLGALHKFSSGLTGIFYEQTGTNKAGEAIYELTDAGDKLVRTFKGVFAVLDIITTIVGGGLKIGFKVLTEILSYFNLGILDVTAIIGDVIVGFRDWLDSLINIPKILDNIVPIVKKVISVIKDFAGAVKDSEGFEIATNIIKGLINGLKNGASAVWDAAVDMVKSLIEKVKAVLGIHSPSTEFIEIGKNIIDGLILGIQNGASKLWESFKNIVLSIVDWVKDLDLGTILAGVFAIGLFTAFKNLSVLINGFGGISDGIAGVLENVGNALGGVSKVLNGVALDYKADAVKKFAIAIAILIGSVALLGYVCGREDVNMKKAVGVVAMLSVVLLAISAAMSAMAKADISFGKSGLRIKGLTTSLISIGIAVLLMALTAKMIGNMDPATTEKSFKGLVGVILSLVGVLVACKLLTLGGTEGANELGKTMRKIAVTMLLLVLVAKLIASMSWDDMGKAAVGLGGLVVVISLLMLATSMVGPNADKIGKTISKISVAMLLLVLVAKLIASMSWDDMGKAAVGLGGLVVIIGLLMAITNLVGPNASKMGLSIMGVASAMFVMAMVARIIAEMDEESLKKGIKLITQFGIIITGLMAATNLVGPNAGKIGLTILSISVAIGILATIAIILGMVKIENLAKGIVIVGLLSAMVAGMLYAARGVNEFDKTMTKMVVAIGILVGAAWLLTRVNTKKLAKSTLALSLIMGTFAAMIKATNGLEADPKSLASLMGVVVLLAGILLVMSKMKVGSSIKNAGAISLLLVVLSGALVALSKVKVNSSIYGTIGALAVLALVVLELGAILHVINKLNIGNAMPTVTALSVLIIVLTGVLAALTGLGSIMAASQGMAVAGLAGALVALAALGLVVLELGYILKLIKDMNIGDAMPMVKALSIMLITMTGVLVALTAIGFFAPAAFAGVIAMAVLGLVVWELGAILKKLNSYDLAGSMPTINVLSVLLNNLTDILGKLAVIGLFVGPAVAGIGALTVLVTSIGALMAAFSTIATLVPDLETFLDKGIGILVKIAEGLGSAMGSFIGSLGESVSDSLPTIGQNIADFIDVIATAAKNAINIESTSFDGVYDLIKVLAAIALTSIGTSIADMFSSIVGEKTSMEKFSSDCTSFIKAMDSISAAASDANIDEAAITAVGNAGLLMASLQSALPRTGGWIQEVAGEKDLAAFGDSCVAFGEDIANFSKTVSGENAIDVNAAKAAADAGTVMASLQSALPRTGGWIQEVAGEKDLAAFGNSCVAFGEAIVSFSKSISGENAIDVNAAEDAADAGTVMASLQSALPRTGGWIQDVVGEKDLATFGDSCVAFGEAIVSFSKSVSGENAIDVNAAQAAADAGTIMASLQSALPKTGGWIQDVVGGQDLEDFGDKIEAFGEAITDFSSTASEINSEGIDVAITAAYRMKSLIEAVAGIDTSGVEAFTGVGTGGIGADGPMSDIADAIAAFSTKVAGIDTTALSSSVTAATRLKNLITSLVGLDTSGVTSFGKAEEIGTAMGDYAASVKEYDVSAVSSSISAATRLKNFINSLADIDNSGIGKFKLTSIGSSMKSYINSVKDIDVGAVSSSISAANRLKNFINSLADLDNSGLTKFKAASVGKAVKSYATSVSDIDTSSVSSSITTANKLKNLINSLADLDTSGVGAFTAAINELGTISIDAVVTAFSNSSSKLVSSGSSLIDAVAKGMKLKQLTLVTTVTSITTAMYKAAVSKAATFMLAGIMLMTKFTAGVVSRKSSVVSALTSSLSSAAIGARGYYSNFYSAGAYLVSGFANGISANRYKATAQARAMATAAKNAAESALGIASPSKVFYKIGDYTGQGFVKALHDYGNKSYNAGTEMAISAKNGLNDAIGKIVDMVSGDLDIQPTVRPVLDLSDIKSGADTIGSILGSGTSVGVLSDVGRISTMMNRRVQNGGNVEIVSAIDKLRKDIGNVGNTSYNINGVTYDDGSNIAEAVKAIVRAARMERRM